MSGTSTAVKKPIAAANDGEAAKTSPKSLEIVIALVGYAGAGCSDVANKLEITLNKKGYTPHKIKLSKIIEELSAENSIPEVSEKAHLKGETRLARAMELQNLGDKIRSDISLDAIVRKAVEKFEEKRGGEEPGKSKIAFILDSVKHLEEIELLKELYGPSFRLLAVHCSKPVRFQRLHGDVASEAKFCGAGSDKIRQFMERDEKDKNKNKFGQQVRDAFYLGDYFLDNDNNNDEASKAKLLSEIDRFTDLLLGKRLFRPTREESGIYHAFSASRHSSCLSRQVGAAIQTIDGRLLADGANEVPSFGGGVYGEDSSAIEKRCFGWEFTHDGPSWTGCHNTRKKHQIKNDIANWMANSLFIDMANSLDETGEKNFDKDRFLKLMQKGITLRKDDLENAPGIGQLIEFSRSIHAEMDAVLTAGRSGHSTVGTTLYCTTYPCHNCARHLVTAGIRTIVYVEPYVKSLALELHSDSITDQLSSSIDENGNPVKVYIKAFTGVGPRMFDLHFKKTLDLKNQDGSYIEPLGGEPVEAVRIETLKKNEQRVIDMTKPVS